MMWSPPSYRNAVLHWNRALQPGSSGWHQALAYAAEQSFQTIAIIPVILFVIFGAVWLFERRAR